MTNYNDGKWHGWNGGECPVNPDSLIVCAYRSLSTSATGQYAGMGTRAAIAPWADIIAFRVTKPAPPKPREWWLNPDGRGLVAATNPNVTFIPPWVLVREVIE